MSSVSPTKPLPSPSGPSSSVITKKKSKGDGGFVLKTAKGTRDYGPLECKVREEVVDTIRRIYRKHGGQAIETPVFELKETLTGKYGEDTKLIYDLADQGGEICALRYDLTVPFARYCAMNNIKSMKRYQIGRVYRRDRPLMTKGRYREFYQCDFDICGEADPMIPDAEILQIATETLSQLDLGHPFLIKVNHRLLLDGIFEACGVPVALFRPICSAVDKLDKLPWDEVAREMTQEKGLDPEVAARIQQFVVLGSQDVFPLLDQLDADPLLATSKSAKTGLAHLRLLFGYLQAFGALERIRFDLSLARGLDYYTGVIFEAVLPGTDGIGSIAGGGRYDGLISMFAAVGKKNKKPPPPVPCVGFSLGIERIFSILTERALSAQQSDTLILLAQFPCPDPAFITLQRMQLAQTLWAEGVSVEVLPKVKPQLKNALTWANSRKIPLVGILGVDEVATSSIVIKNLLAAEDDPNKQFNLPLTKLVPLITRLKASTTDQWSTLITQSLNE